MTDGEMVKLMVRISLLNGKMCDLLREISRHPNGEAMLDELHDNGVGLDWEFAEIAHAHLVHPERWTFVNRFTLRWKAKAAEAAGGE